MQGGNNKFKIMKKTFLILSIAFFTALSSCQKDEPVNVDFSVNTTDVIVNVTDSVTFNLKVETGI